MEIHMDFEPIYNLLAIKNSNLKLSKKTLTICDWDNTLFPTSYIISHLYIIDNPSLASNDIKDYFCQLSNLIQCIIFNAKKYGEFVIITNALSGWVERSCNLMPDLLPILKTINIISARSDWEKIDPLPEKWKEFAFLKKTTDFIGNDTNIVINLICIGDSPYEHDASKNVASVLNANSYYMVFTKNFVFKMNPIFDELLIQLYHLANNLNLNKDNVITNMKSYQLSIPYTEQSYHDLCP